MSYIYILFLFPLIMGFIVSIKKKKPVGTLMGLAIGIGISKKNENL